MIAMLLLSSLAQAQALQLASVQGPGSASSSERELVGRVQSLRGSATINGVPVQLRLSTKVFLNDVIVVSDGGQMIVRFIDGTSLVVAGNSEILVDEFVIDLRNGPLDGVWESTQGLFRFLAPSPPKRDLRSVVAVLGIRG